MRSDRRPNSKPLLLPHELVEEERLSRVELSDHGHHGDRGVDVVEETDVAADDLQVSMVVGVGVDELDRPLREQGWQQEKSIHW